ALPQPATPATASTPARPAATRPEGAGNLRRLMREVKDISGAPCLESGRGVAAQRLVVAASTTVNDCGGRVSVTVWASGVSDPSDRRTPSMPGRGRAPRSELAVTVRTPAAPSNV